MELLPHAAAASEVFSVKRRFLNGVVIKPNWDDLLPSSILPRTIDRVLSYDGNTTGLLLSHNSNEFHTVSDSDNLKTTEETIGLMKGV